MLDESTSRVKVPEKALRLQQKSFIELQFQQAKHLLSPLKAEKTNLERQHQQAKTWLAGERERQQQAEEQAKAAQTEFTGYLDRSVAEIAKAHGVPDVLMEDLNETVNAKLIAFSLQNGRKDLPFSAYEGVIKNAVERYAKVHHLAGRQKLQAVSKAKIATSNPAPQRARPTCPARHNGGSVRELFANERARLERIGR